MLDPLNDSLAPFFFSHFSGKIPPVPPWSLGPHPRHWQLLEKNHPTLKNGATERSQPPTSCNSSMLPRFSGQLSLFHFTPPPPSPIFNPSVLRGSLLSSLLPNPPTSSLLHHPPLRLHSGPHAINHPPPSFSAWIPDLVPEPFRRPLMIKKIKKKQRKRTGQPFLDPTSPPLISSPSQPKFSK